MPRRSTYILKLLAVLLASFKAEQTSYAKMVLNKIVTMNR